MDIHDTCKARFKGIGISVSATVSMKFIIMDSYNPNILNLSISPSSCFLIWKVGNLGGPVWNWRWVHMVKELFVGMIGWTFSKGGCGGDTASLEAGKLLLFLYPGLEFSWTSESPPALFFKPFIKWKEYNENNLSCKMIYTCEFLSAFHIQYNLFRFESNF